MVQIFWRQIYKTCTVRHRFKVDGLGASRLAYEETIFSCDLSNTIMERVPRTGTFLLTFENRFLFKTDSDLFLLLSFFWHLFPVIFCAGICGRLLSWRPRWARSTWDSSYRTWHCGGVVCQGHQWSQRCGGRAQSPPHWRQYLRFHVHHCAFAQHAASPDKRWDHEKGDSSLVELDHPAPEDK